MLGVPKILRVLMVYLLGYIGQTSHYKWHINDGEEVFVVLDGVEQSSTLVVGDIFYASIGTEHVAHPRGEARVLVIESEGSV